MGASGWRQFRAWFFQEEPCSFLGLRLWELDKNSLSEAAVSGDFRLVVLWTGLQCETFWETFWETRLDKKDKLAVVFVGHFAS